MGLAVVQTRAGTGINACPVRVEVHLSNGLPAFHLVGMAETSVKEARDRVRSAIINSGFEFPAKRITVNLAPADTPKLGGRFDLPIALGILAAAGLIQTNALANSEFIGELGLEGDVKAINGIIPVALGAQASGNTLFYPPGNAEELALVDKLSALASPSLQAVYNHLIDVAKLQYVQAKKRPSVSLPPQWDDIVGQEQAKRALMIAAAGFHNLLFVGPPGTGKSMLAGKLLSLLPPMTTSEAIEVVAIHSLKGAGFNQASFFQRPFRAPHHTSSAIALTGGGSHPSPGEVSLAHNGVLFLDELPEFGRKTLDVLREPLETGDVHITRASGHATFPARFQLIAAMNPSPTGDIHDGRTTPEQIMQYLNRLSGPLLDRIDLQVEVPRLNNYSLGFDNTVKKEDSINHAVADVQRAQEVQLERQGKLNGKLAASELYTVCKLADADAAFFESAAKQLTLSMRVYHRLLKVSRTIADIDGACVIQRQHLAEALGYRALDTLMAKVTPSY